VPSGKACGDGKSRKDYGWFPFRAPARMGQAMTVRGRRAETDRASASLGPGDWQRSPNLSLQSHWERIAVYIMITLLTGSKSSRLQIVSFKARKHPVPPVVRLASKAEATQTD